MRNDAVPEANVAQIEQKIEALEDAYNRRDVEGLLTAWGPNFIDIPDGLPILKGSQARERKRKNIVATFESFDGTLKISPLEIASLGESSVVVQGHLVISLRTKQGGQVTTIKRRFLEVWIRGPSGWAIEYGMTNSDPELSS